MVLGDVAATGAAQGVAAGVDWVTANAIKPAVANMSLGGSPDPTLESAVSRSIASGVSYAIAAGNSSGTGTGPGATHTTTYTLTVTGGRGDQCQG